MPYRDPEKRRAYGRDWMQRNAGKAREAMQRWRRRHPDQHRAESRASYARDPQARQRQIDASPNRNAVRRAMHQRRRARLLRASGSYSYREWMELVAAYAGRCAYCGVTGSLHADHRTPLSRGGPNSIDNIVPACPTCNLKKQTMTEEEFRDRPGTDGH